MDTFRQNSSVVDDRVGDAMDADVRDAYASDAYASDADDFERVPEWIDDESHDPPSRSRYRPLLSAAAATAAGISADRALESLDGQLALAWAGLALASLLAWQGIRFRMQVAAGWLVLASSAFSAALWHHLYWNAYPTNDLAFFAQVEPQPACIEAVLCEAPLVTPAEPSNPLRVRPLGPITETTVEPSAIRDRGVWRPCAGRARLRIAGEDSSLRTGDRIRVFAKLGMPTSPLNPGEYDWRTAERGQRRLSELYCSSVDCVVVMESSPYGLLSGVDALRAWCRRQLARCVGPHDAPLALAIVLGAREQLDDEKMQAYLRTGTIHLLVISGLHVGMLAGLVWWLVALSGGPQSRRIVVTATAVLLYTAIVGPRPPVIRATVLVLALLAALASGRRASRLNLLAAAALVVMAYNPTELFRAGTQLSFLSATVLLAMSRWLGRPRPVDPLDRLLLEASPWPYRVVRWLGKSWASLAIASLVVWGAALPLVGSRFHIAAPIGVVITPFVWPLVATALAAGLGALSIGWLLTPLDAWMGAVAAWCLKGVQQIVALAERVPFGHAYGPGLPDWWLAGLYLGVALAVLTTPRSLLGYATSTVLGIAWAGLGVFVAWGPRSPCDELRCTFLAMGHGVATVVELPEGETLLYDGGSLASPTAATRIIAEFLWSRGIRKIDAIMISHADLDHFNGVPGIAEIFPIGAVYVTPQMAQCHDQRDNPAVDALFETLTRRGVQTLTVGAGDRLNLRDERASVQILHPDRSLARRGVGAGRQTSDNALSMVAEIGFTGRSIVLPGDLESPGLEQLTQTPRKDSDVLLAPHHGSVHSDPPGFSRWSTPEWTIVSGKEPSAATPLQESYAGAGRRVLCTANCGAIEIRLSRGGVAADAFLGLSRLSLGSPAAPAGGSEAPDSGGVLLP